MHFRVPTVALDVPAGELEADAQHLAAVRGVERHLEIAVTGLRVIEVRPKVIPRAVGLDVVGLRLAAPLDLDLLGAGFVLPNGYHGPLIKRPDRIAVGVIDAHVHDVAHKRVGRRQLVGDHVVVHRLVARVVRADVPRDDRLGSGGARVLLRRGAGRGVGDLDGALGDAGDDVAAREGHVGHEPVSVVLLIGKTVRLGLEGLGRHDLGQGVVVGATEVGLPIRGGALVARDAKAVLSRETNAGARGVAVSHGDEVGGRVIRRCRLGAGRGSVCKDEGLVLLEVALLELLVVADRVLPVAGGRDAEHRRAPRSALGDRSLLVDNFRSALEPRERDEGVGYRACRARCRIDRARGAARRRPGAVERGEREAARQIVLDVVHV